MHPDQRYIEALLRKDGVLIDQIYKLHLSAIQRYILANSGTHDDALDIFQDALVALITSPPVLTTGLGGYLFSVCQNLWLTKLNAKGRDPLSKIDEGSLVISDKDGVYKVNLKLADKELNPEELLTTLMEHEKQGIVSSAVRKALKMIRPACEKLLKLVFGGYDNEEVAMIRLEEKGVVAYDGERLAAEKRLMAKDKSICLNGFEIKIKELIGKNAENI